MPPLVWFLPFKLYAPYATTAISDTAVIIFAAHQFFNMSPSAQADDECSWILLNFTHYSAKSVRISPK